MPLVFGAHCGSMLALTGTPVNVLVYEASLDAGRGGFGYFEFALAGVPLLLGGILIAILLGERLLPERENKSLPPDLSGHARTLVEQFRLTDDVHQLRVRADSPLVGADARPRSRRPAGVTLVTVQAGEEGGAAGSAPCRRATCCWCAAGGGGGGAGLRAGAQPSRRRRRRPIEDTLFNRASGLAEVVIPPRSPLIGDRLFPAWSRRAATSWCWRSSGRAQIGAAATARGGRHAAPAGHLGGARRAPGAPEVLVVNSPDLVRRQALPMGRGRQADAGGPRRYGVPAGDGPRAAGGRGASRGRRRAAPRRAQRR